MSETTKEPQYSYMLDLAKNQIRVHGLVSNAIINDDPKRMVFLLSRYKFVSKIFSGFNSVLEIGCGDGTGSVIVKQVVNELIAADFDKVFIDDAKSRPDSKWPITFIEHDFLQGPTSGEFDGIYALDVLEHIDERNENLFLSNALKPLRKDGIAIFGMPSVESQAYASRASIEGHVNCKSGEELKQTLLKFFDRVVIFSMNDEVVHTGFYPMAQYLLAVCFYPKKGDRD